MEYGQEKNYSFLANDTFPNLYDALVYEGKFMSEYLERQIYETVHVNEQLFWLFLKSTRHFLGFLRYWAFYTHDQDKLEIEYLR